MDREFHSLDQNWVHRDNALSINELSLLRYSEVLQCSISLNLVQGFVIKKERGISRKFVPPIINILFAENIYLLKQLK